MMRSLWTAASGMTAQQFNIDTIANNLSNVNTTGFKQIRADFEDLLYQTTRVAGTPATEVTVVPTGVQVGHGVKVAATQRIFTQGSLQSTGNVSDMAIQGEGFYRVLLYDGTYGYTRDGSFKIDSNGQLVNSNGYMVMPEVVLPDTFVRDSLTISQDGRITVKVAGTDDPLEVGQMELYRFVNPTGCQASGENLFKVSNASGDPIGGRPGFEGMGKLALPEPLIRIGPRAAGAPTEWHVTRSSLNPSMLPLVVGILLELERMGVQIFIATHSYVLLKEFDLQCTDHSLRFYSLSMDKNMEIGLNTSETYTGLSPNRIADQFARMYNVEIDRALGGNNG